MVREGDQIRFTNGYTRLIGTVNRVDKDKEYHVTSSIIQPMVINSRFKPHRQHYFYLDTWSNKIKRIFCTIFRVYKLYP